MRGDMETRPVIGLSAWTRPFRSGTKERLNEAVPRPYTEGVEAAGGLPVLLPNSADTHLADSYLDLVDGLLLIGGDDIHPRFYGEAPHPGLDVVDERRDRFEMALVRAARSRGLPVFGICRGLQLMNVALGGDLYQDIPSQAGSAIGHRQLTVGEGPWHEVEVRTGTRLAGIVGGARASVNSYHHQACRQVAPGLVVAATAPDGIVEGIEDPHEPFFLGVQWHPEVLEGGADPLTRRLFAAFVSACRSRRSAASKGRGAEPASHAPAGSGVLASPPGPA